MQAQGLAAPATIRKSKDKDPQNREMRDAQPTDLAERMIAFQRKNASATRSRDRTERQQQPLPSTSRAAVQPEPKQQLPQRSSHTSPRKVTPMQEADPEDFSRRLKISPSSPRGPKASSSKLFNPNTDPIPSRLTAEPEVISDNGSGSFVPRGSPNTPHASAREVSAARARQLFDHKQDDPVRFHVSVMSRPHVRTAPTSRSSGDYVSASSTSSYANSVVSSTFTLSSNTDSSASSALLEQPNQSSEEPGNNVFVIQLKKLYRAITALETKIKTEDSEEQVDSRVQIKGKEVIDEDKERQKWKNQIQDHKRLAEIMHNLLEISLSPSVPTSLRNMPTKYNIIVRLWTYGFHKLLESLRRASFSSQLAFEHLQDFIYYSYTFYTGLLEEPTLNPFKSGWLEALGDLARYRMAVAAMVTSTTDSGQALTTAAVSKAAAEANSDISKPKSETSISVAPAGKIDSPTPSVGLAAARLLEVEPEKERWRCIARDWYAAGLTDTPGAGKLHHHLGLLSREAESEELRGIYHFVKSMTTLHPFATSRESILPMWSAAAQSRRAQPDARASELFVLLHGMIFTNIQLDDFAPTLSRFVERLEIEGLEEREWIMMAVVNVCSVLEYGRPGGVLKRVGGLGSRDSAAAPVLKTVVKRPVEEERMDVDGEEGSGPPLSPPATPATGNFFEYPAALKHSLQLTFAMLSFVLRNPTRKASQYAQSTLNPYLTILLTFLATILKNSAVLEVLDRSIPWAELASFFATIPRKVMASQGLAERRRGSAAQSERWAMLTSGCPPPLSEDWCLRGMEWVGRRVFERGFWKSGEDRQVELEVLDHKEAVDVTDGIIEDEDGDEASKSGLGGETARRWIRVVRCAVGIAETVEGFEWKEGTREWRVAGKLEQKVHRWKEEERLEREEDEARRTRRRWDDSMDVDEVGTESEEESEDDEGDSEEIKELKARRRYLRSLVQSSKRSRSSTLRQPRARGVRKESTIRQALNIAPGYSVLVVDTNILLSSLSNLSSVIESLRWTVVVPLPVIMELDGLSANPTPLGDAAQAALSYITTHLRSHASALKVQTSRGNYLTSLNVRTEQVEFDSEGSVRNMDDLILKAAIWQDEHWVDRSALLKPGSTPQDTSTAVRVVLLTLDRNLRLKARSRQLPAASEQDLAFVFSNAT